jgi:hypothetical protein
LGTKEVEKIINGVAIDRSGTIDYNKFVMTATNSRIFFLSKENKKEKLTQMAVSLSQLRRLEAYPVIVL